jgi:2,3-bisphosphoglycerate-dependent phosphoglycerate mutase
MEDPFLIKHADATELFIVRHGDAIPDADEIIPSGIYDDLPLSRLGREQARDLAERLGRISFDAVYSSPLRRCQETAAPLARRLELTPILVPGIKEIRLGDIRPLPEHGEDLSMLTQALKERQIDIVRIAGNTGSWDTIPNSEPSKEFRQRVVTAFDEIAHSHAAGGRVIAFAHGGVVNAYVAEVLGLERDFFFPAANTSITVVRVLGERRVLYVLNDVAHIKRHV